MHLFEEAQSSVHAFTFIGELDAFGRPGGNNHFHSSSNDEAKQTLIQWTVWMDWTLI